MTENISNFIAFHNDHISNQSLAVSFETISSFAIAKTILLEDISIEKHRLPFINWLTGLSSTGS